MSTTAHRGALRLGGIALTLLAGGASPAFAYLGSYGPSEGYNLSMFSGSYNWVDVAYYNAGAHGPLAGGGSATHIAPDTGLWRQVSNVGGFFTSGASRTANLGGTPPYPTAHPDTLNSGAAYIVGGHFPGRNNDGYNLALRNDTPLGTGAITYDYSIDTYDTGGVAPASQSTGILTFQTYFMSDPDSPLPSDGSRQDKFTMSFADSSGNVGMQWGYSRDNQVSFRDSASSAWNYTSWNAGPANWNGVRIQLDLTNDVFGMDYYDEATNTWNNVVPLGAAMGAGMNNFTTIRWQLEDGVSLGIGGKNFFDDSTFTGYIPTPGTVLVLGMAGVIGSRRRRA